MLRLQLLIAIAVLSIVAKTADKNCAKCGGSGKCCSRDNSTCNCGTWDSLAGVMQGSSAGQCFCTK